MKISSDKLAAQLKKKLPPFIWISGDEPLQQLEMSDAIRHKARQQGCEERVIFDVGPQFKWGQLLQATQNQSLFGGAQLIEVRLGSQKTGKEGSQVLQDLARQDRGQDIFLITSAKLDATQSKSAWYKALDAQGWFIPVWPVPRAQLPRWIEQRLAQHGLSAEPDALRLLAEKVEGNLLAAAQEIQKLLLFVSPGEPVTTHQLMELIQDASRFSLFDLADACLEGQLDRALRILDHLQAEGTEAPLLIWALSREIRQVARLLAQPHHFEQQCQQWRIWPQRQPLYKKAIQRLSLAESHQLLLLAYQVDRAAKGSGEPFTELLLQLVSSFATRPAPEENPSCV